MTAWNYIVANLRYYRRIHLPVLLGVAVTTAVITGALLVGSSMRGSLRDVVLQRLGRIDSMLVAEQPFRVELAQETLARPELAEQFTEATPILVARGTLAKRTKQMTRRVTDLAVYGVPAEFWSLATNTRGPVEPFAEGDDRTLYVVPLVARDLNANDGDDVLLRLPSTGSIPADSTLGEKEGAFVSRRFTLRVVSPRDCPLYDFSLRPNQQPSHNVFLRLAALQDLFDLPGEANAIAFAIEGVAGSRGAELLESNLHPELGDLGVKVQELMLPGTAAQDSVGRVAQISADRLVLPQEMIETISQQFPKSRTQAAIAYLANSIRLGEKSVPYSTISGIDSTVELGPLFDEAGEPSVLEENEVVLNDWTAERLEAQVDDEITIHYYQPESSHGELVEGPPLRLKLRAIVPLANGEGKPTRAADPQLTPELPGVTDKDSIDSWELPFELVEEVVQADEDYWDDHRTTPKAFVSHELAQRLWKTRWGVESLVRLPMDDQSLNEELTINQVRQRLRDSIDPAALGMNVLAVKQTGLAAASGTTPFDALFLGFSFFLMASAVLLTALLFRLGVQQRARESGLLLAVGGTGQRVRRLLIGEGLIVAVVGAILGVLFGILYARLMIYGLNHWWLAATVSPFMRLHVSPLSLAIGWLAGVIVSALAIAWTVRGLLRQQAKELLAGRAEPDPAIAAEGAAWQRRLPAACLLLAAAVGAFAWQSEGEAQAGAFFSGGALVLIGLLAAVRRWLRRPTEALPSHFSTNKLSISNTRRNPTRTVLTVGLAAAASFLLVALSAFRLEPSQGGTGGFDLLATADVPLHYDLSTQAGRDELGVGNEAEQTLATARIVGFRVQEGEDASCLNLFQTAQPRILGVPPQLGASSHFDWGSTLSDPVAEDPWELLDVDLGEDDAGRPVTPVVLDRNTAYYSLKLYQIGARLTVTDGAGQPRTLEVVGMLANSLFQGDLLISESHFLELFPETAGRRFFLIGAGDAKQRQELASLLETQLEDYGFDAVDARQRLAEFMAVQNTYLSTFQSLGGLGLLLGVVGVAVVQLRSVAERRQELALMRAQGFHRSQLIRMVFTENLTLLLAGLGIGAVAAAAVVLPHALASQAGVPWLTLVGLLGLIGVVGAATGWLAIRSALQTPLLPALRGD